MKWITTSPVVMKSLYKGTLVAGFVGFAQLLVSCAPPPVYQATSDGNYMGSIHYIQADCQSCHGAEWDGAGSDAKRLKKSGFVPTNFIAGVPDDKTPLDYFRAISDPAGYFGKEKVQDQNFQLLVISRHSFHSYTDRARWQIANFLFEKANAPQDANKRNEALARANQELSKIYPALRRWEIGYAPLASRITPPDEAALIKNVKFAEPLKAGEVTDARVKAVHESAGAGADLYNVHCKNCHGVFAEGGASVRYGLIPSRNPDVEKTYQNIPRQDAVFLRTKDLKNSASMNSVEAFKSVHSDTTGHLTPTFQSFTDQNWQELHAYTKRITGK